MGSIETSRYTGTYNPYTNTTTLMPSSFSGNYPITYPNTTYGTSSGTYVSSMPSLPPGIPPLIPGSSVPRPKKSKGICDDPTGFVEACEKGHLDIVQHMLYNYNARATIEAQPNSILTGFNRACQLGNLEIVRTIAISGNVHKYLGSGIWYACISGHLEVVQLITKYVKDFNWSLYLDETCKYYCPRYSKGQNAIMRYILDIDDLVLPTSFLELQVEVLNDFMPEELSNTCTSFLKERV
jgi:hypothetical protein